MPCEFEFIKKYFLKLTSHGNGVITGIGDDAAVIRPPLDEVLLVSTDTLVESTHFFSEVSSHALGYKSLAVNLSDMAAMGACPRWLTLALTMPALDEIWLAGFCEGFGDLANEYHLALVGGDLTAGPLSVTVQLMGTAPAERILYRSGAQLGDKIYVTGYLGNAAGAVWTINNKQSVAPLLKESLDYPVPQVAWGQVLGGVAHSAIDISDGLLADLGHIMRASGKQGRVNYQALPVAHTLKKNLGEDKAYLLALTGGDDYGLCFTVAPEKEAWLQKQARALSVKITCIGEVQMGSGLVLLDNTGDEMSLPQSLGYTHW